MSRVMHRLRVFDARFYFLALTATSLTGAYTTFAGFAPDYLEKRFAYSQTDASSVAALLSVANIVCTPLLGVAFHRMRHVSIGLVVSFALAMMACSHLYLAFIPAHWPVQPPVVAIGFAFSMLAAALWPALPLIVRESHTGTAYGVLYAMQVRGFLFCWLNVLSVVVVCFECIVLRFVVLFLNFFFGNKFE